MKYVLGLVIGGVGISTLVGCGAQVGDDAGEESIASQSEAVLVTAAARSRGQRRDYNGDGKEDLILSDAVNGTYEVLGAAPGGYSTSPNTYINPSTTPDNTIFNTAGDFNNDGKSDVLVMTTSGTSLWTGTAGGGFTQNVWSTSLFKKVGNGPNADITVGDFNGDNFTDFIATTSAGSYLYTGKASTGGASCCFNANVWTNTTAAFRRGTLSFSVGNFDADGTSDFIATTTAGSYLYLGTAGSGATGGFSSSPVWSDTSLKNDVYPNVVRIVVGNFNGVGADDFIVQKSNGAFLYTSAAGPSFALHAWSQASLEITGSPLIVGDYNGDGCSDFLYQDGSALKVRVYKQGTPSVPGTFNPALSVDTRFPVFYDSSIKRADFNGDGKDDFLLQTRPTTGNGSFEFTGSANVGTTATPAPAKGGFNADVWTSTMFYQGSAF
jgi:hypothetical protein